MKTCLACLKEKNETEFYANEDGKDGLHSRCKRCLKRYASERYQAKQRKLEALQGEVSRLGAILESHGIDPTTGVRT